MYMYMYIYHKLHTMHDHHGAQASPLMCVTTRACALQQLCAQRPLNPQWDQMFLSGASAFAAAPVCEKCCASVHSVTACACVEQSARNQKEVSR